MQVVNNILKILCFLSGRQHLKQVEFCQCISDSATLLKLHLWPGSPTKPKVAFHFNFMDLAEKFLLESHVSLHKFCSSAEIEYPDMLPKLVCNNYILLLYIMYVMNDIVQNDANCHFVSVS